MAPEARSAVVVGGGSIGSRHAKNLATLGVRVAVVDPDNDVRDRLSTEIGCPTYPGSIDALEKEAPDLVVVATPTRYHLRGAMEAAERGCHLFVEKPLSDSTKGVSELESIVGDRALVSIVGCNLRFQPEIRKMRSLLSSNAIGRVLAARIQGGSYLPGWFPESDYRASYSARSDLGGGVILDYIHEINYARWFFGEFTTVSAMVGQLSSLEIETNDVAGILGETKGGAVVQFHLDYVQRPYSRSCHIVGEEGTIRWQWDEGTVEWRSVEDDTWRTYERPAEWEMNDMYVDEMAHFLECVRTGDQTTCPIECGRRDLSVAFAARESSASGEHVTLADRCME